MPQLKSALNEWKSVEGTIAAQLLDPGIKDTLLASDEKVAAGQKFQSVFSRYVGQQGSVHAPQPKAGGGSIRDSMLATLRESSVSSVAENVEYLNTGTVPDVPVLTWWKNFQFPVAQKIARDFLAIPASSVQSERENSKARYVITDVCNRLSSKTV